MPIFVQHPARPAQAAQCYARDTGTRGCFDDALVPANSKGSELARVVWRKTDAMVFRIGRDARAIRVHARGNGSWT